MIFSPTLQGGLSANSHTTAPKLTSNREERVVASGAVIESLCAREELKGPETEMLPIDDF